MRLLAALLCSTILLTPAPAAPDPHPDWGKTAHHVRKSLVKVEFTRQQVHPLFGDQGWIPSACTAWAIRLETFVSAAHCSEGVEHKVNGIDAMTLLTDKKLDIWVFRVSGLHLPPLQFIEGEISQGDQVGTLGYGYGENDPILRLAYVSHPHMGYENAGETVESLTLDNGFVGGQSGAPIVDQYGHVVSVATQSDNFSGWGRSTKDLKKALKDYR